VPAHLLSQLTGTLSPDERTRAERFVFPRDRSRFAAGRGILRDILGRYLDGEPRTVGFRYGPRGKPSLDVPPGSARLHFNLAHSGGLAVCALSTDGEVGVDLEAFRPLDDASAMARLVFTAAEQAELSSCPPGQRAALFLNGWTRKEAFVKAVGDGLSRTLTGIEVGLTAGPPGEARPVGGPALTPAERRHWRVRRLIPASGFVAAVAGGSLCRLSYWRWPPGPAAAGPGGAG
jgi:4'-phosphopantetheinyl transferase